MTDVRFLSALSLVLSLVVSLVLSACGGDPSHPGSIAQDPISVPAQADASTYDPAAARALAVQSMGLEDLAKAEAATLRATELAPSMVDAWLLLAGVRAKKGDLDGAFDALDAMADLGVRAPVDQFPPLQPLHEDPRWAELGARLESHLQPAGSSDVLFTLEETDLLTEDVAFDRTTDAWYVSAVHARKIVRIGSDGSISDWLADRDDVWGVFGLALDTERRRLWAATAMMPQVRGFDSEAGTKTALLEVDLDSAEIVAKFSLEPSAPSDGESENETETQETEVESQAAAAPQLNDLVVAADGTVYATDLTPPGGVYRLAPGVRELERIGEGMLLNSPQGIVLLDDDKLLVVADYSLGLVALNLESGDSWFVEPPYELWFQTFDGLASAGDGELVAIQNGGYPPHRILRLQLSPDRRSIVRWSVAARALPEWNEPTLGTVVRDGAARRFVYVAASQWPLFPAGEEPDASRLTQPVIMTLDLAP